MGLDGMLTALSQQYFPFKIVCVCLSSLWMEDWGTNRPMMSPREPKFCGHVGFDFMQVWASNR
jgi:hypothetical protein